MTNQNRVQHDVDGQREQRILLVLPDERPARQARLTAAEVRALFRPGTPSPVESRPFIRHRRTD